MEKQTIVLLVLNHKQRFGGNAVAGAIPSSLSKIQTYFSSEDPAGADNAVGALCRILLTGYTELPVADMLKVVFANLPLKVRFISIAFCPTFFLM